jgi:hypothetical protein
LLLLLLLLMLLLHCALKVWTSVKPCVTYVARWQAPTELHS